MTAFLEATLAPEAVVPTIVETVAQALKLPFAAILLKRDDAFTVAASFGNPQGELLTLPLVYQRESRGMHLFSCKLPRNTILHCRFGNMAESVLVGSPDTIRQRLAAFETAGVQELIIGFPDSLQGNLDSLRFFAREFLA